MRLRCIICSLSLLFFSLKYFIVKSASLIFRILQVHVITAIMLSVLVEHRQAYGCPEICSASEQGHKLFFYSNGACPFCVYHSISVIA